MSHTIKHSIFINPNGLLFRPQVHICRPNYCSALCTNIRFEFALPVFNCMSVWASLLTQYRENSEQRQPFFRQAVTVSRGDSNYCTSDVCRNDPIPQTHTVTYTVTAATHTYTHTMPSHHFTRTHRDTTHTETHHTHTHSTHTYTVTSQHFLERCPGIMD